MKSTLRLFLVLIGFMTLSLTAFPQNLLEGCQEEGFVFKGNTIIFNPTNTSHRAFLIHNISPYRIVLNRYTPIQPEAMGNAGWTSKLNSDGWSALAMSQLKFEMTCQGFNPPYYQMANCQNVISVCSYPAKDSIGSFWIAENTSLLNNLNTLKQRNILK